MAKKKEEEKQTSYILGIVALALSFFQPLPAIILGIVGLVINKKEKSKIAKKLNILAIVVGVLVIAALIWLTFSYTPGALNLPA